MNNREIDSVESRGFPAVVALKNRIAEIENLVKGFAARGILFPTALRGKLVELQNLKSSLFRIESRILAGERDTFTKPIRTENRKRTLLG